MASKTAAANGSRQRAPARKAAVAKPGKKKDPRYWKKALERNLILEGYSPAEAKELVAISAK